MSIHNPFLVRERAFECSFGNVSGLGEGWVGLSALHRACSVRREVKVNESIPESSLAKWSFGIASLLSPFPLPLMGPQELHTKPPVWEPLVYCKGMKCVILHYMERQWLWLSFQEVPKLLQHQVTERIGASQLEDGKRSLKLTCQERTSQQDWKEKHWSRCLKIQIQIFCQNSKCFCCCDGLISKKAAVEAVPFVTLRLYCLGSD